GPAGSRRRCSARRAPSPPRGSRSDCPTATQDTLVADASRQPVGVEALEQELRGPAADAEQVAETRERDAPRRLALCNERTACLLVRPRRNGVAVADPHEAALLLEEARDGRVVDLDRLEPEAGLERGG